MEGNFSNRVQDVIRLSREEALRLGHDYMGRNICCWGSYVRGGDRGENSPKPGGGPLQVEKGDRGYRPHVGGNPDHRNIPLTKQAEKVLKISTLKRNCTNRMLSERNICSFPLAGR